MNQATIFNQHDHQLCISSALRKAQDRCTSRKVRLTAIRHEIFRYLWESHKAIGAYDLLARIYRQGRNATPPKVYRALDFMRVHGLIHRIASPKAYSGCACPDYGHQGSFLICQESQSAQEVNQQRLSSAIAQTAEGEDFAVKPVIFEITGLCLSGQASE